MNLGILGHFGGSILGVLGHVVHLGISFFGIFVILKHYGTSWKINILESPLNIPTPTLVPDHPLRGHEGTWGTRVIGAVGQGRELHQTYGLCHVRAPPRR